MTDVLEATHVEPKTTTDVFVVMNCYGQDHWAASMTYKTLEEAQRAAQADGAIVKAWKIVKVSGLPVEVPTGEAETPNMGIKAGGTLPDQET